MCKFCENIVTEMKIDRDYFNIAKERIENAKGGVE